MPDIQNTTEEKGIIGLLIRHGIAKDAAQANQILIAVLVMVIILIVWINFF